MFIGVKLRIIEWFCNQTFRNRFFEYFPNRQTFQSFMQPHTKRLSYGQSFKSLTVLFMCKQALLLYYFLLHLDKTDLIQFMYDW